MRRMFSALAVGILLAATMTAQSHPEVADAGKAWTQKTPWGDPDISGAWTSDDMRGVPRKRAAEYGTRRYLSDEEFSKRLAADSQGHDLTTRSNYQAVLPYECHEGNYMLRNTLSAERTEDRALDADAKRGIVRARKAVQGNINAAPTAAEE